MYNNERRWLLYLDHEHTKDTCGENPGHYSGVQEWIKQKRRHPWLLCRGVQYLRSERQPFSLDFKSIFDRYFELTVQLLENVTFSRRRGPFQILGIAANQAPNADLMWFTVWTSISRIIKYAKVGFALTEFFFRWIEILKSIASICCTSLPEITALGLIAPSFYDSTAAPIIPSSWRLHRAT